MNFLMQILADSAPAGPVSPASPTGPTTPGRGGFDFMFAIMIAMMVFFLLAARSQKKKEQKTREAMFSKMQKNDRVITIGGVIGRVMTIKDQEIVLKVDEDSNTKMTFLRSAVQRVLTDETSTSGGNA